MAIAIFSILLVVLLQIVTQTTKVWQQVSGDSASRQNARLLLQLMRRDLENAVFSIGSTNNLQFQMNPASLNGSGYLNPSAAFWQTAVSGSTAINGDIQDVGYFINWVPDSTGVVHGTLCRIQVARPSFNSATPFLTITPSLLATNAPGLANTDLTSPNAFHGLLADGVVGLWMTLYSSNMNVISASSSYNSASTGAAQPAYADIGIVMLNPGVAKRITTSNLTSITGLYSNPGCTNAASFVSLLSPTFQAGARSFTTRVQIKNVP